jgi:palmitoyltransferase ZDHHC9/14/18
MLQAGIFYVTLLLVIGTTSLFFAFDCPYMAEITPGAVDYHLKGTVLRDEFAFL